MDEKVTCAQRIREALAVRDMTQADLCRITRIGKSAMSQYVNGYLVPRQDRTYLIAKALNVSEAWLMGFDVPMEKNEPASKKEDGLDDLDREVISLFHDLSLDQKQSFLALLKTFRGQPQ